MHRLRRCTGRAVTAEAFDFEDMLGGGKAVCSCEVVDPGAELALVDLDDSVTPSADEVVVVRVAAQPVTEFDAVVS